MLKPQPKNYTSLAALLDKLGIKSASRFLLEETVRELGRAFSAGYESAVNGFGMPNQIFMSPTQFEDLQATLKSITFTDKKLKL